MAWFVPCGRAATAKMSTASGRKICIGFMKAPIVNLFEPRTNGGD
jgi:hypothetical protein